MTKLRGKTALVTGASSGIGAATARGLAKEGVRLILVDIASEPLHSLATELGEENALAWVADVRDLDAMQDAADAGFARFGAIDLVLADAGIAGYGSITAIDPEAFRRVIDINLIGVFHTVRATLPALIESKGYVLIVSSSAAFVALPGGAAYSASKAGAEHFANTLRLEVAHLGVGVGSAHMMWVDTPMVQDIKADLPTFKRSFANFPRPFRKTVTAHTCAAAFVRGLNHRKHRVYVPGWVATLGWLKPLLNSSIGARSTLAQVPDMLPQMDAEMAQLGRSLSSRFTDSKELHSPRS